MSPEEAAELVIGDLVDYRAEKEQGAPWRSGEVEFPLSDGLVCIRDYHRPGSRYEVEPRNLRR